MKGVSCRLYAGKKKIVGEIRPNAERLKALRSSPSGFEERPFGT